MSPIRREAWYRESDERAWEMAVRRAQEDPRDLQAWLELWTLSLRLNKAMPSGERTGLAEWDDIFSFYPKYPDEALVDMYEAWLRTPTQGQELTRKAAQNPDLFLQLLSDKEETWKSLRGPEVTAVWRAVAEADKLPDVSYSTISEWLSSDHAPYLWVGETREDSSAGYSEPDFYSERPRQIHLSGVLSTLRGEKDDPEIRGHYAPYEGEEGNGSSTWRLELPDSDGYLPVGDLSQVYSLYRIQPGHEIKNLTDKLEEWVEA